MKKSLSILFALLFVLFSTSSVLADSSTVFTTVVPAATYTLNIPESQEIPFGTTSLEVGNITVSNSSGFAEGKNLNVTITIPPFSATDIDTTIPFYFVLQSSQSSTEKQEITSGSTITFLGSSLGTVQDKVDFGYDGRMRHFGDKLIFKAKSEDWGKALAGNYSSTVTYTAEVVSGTT